MTTLRSSLIRLAHEKPELRSHLLPLLTKTAATGKTAGDSALEALLPQQDVWGVVRALKGKDAVSAQLLREVYSTLQKRLELSDGEAEALRRLKDVATRGQNWDADLLRNNIFKAANALGLKLPSGTF